MELDDSLLIDLSNELAKTNEVTLITLMDDNVNPKHRSFNRYALSRNVIYYNLGFSNGLMLSSQLKVLKGNQCF